MPLDLEKIANRWCDDCTEMYECCAMFMVSKKKNSERLACFCSPSQPPPDNRTRGDGETCKESKLHERSRK